MSLSPEWIGGFFDGEGSCCFSGTFSPVIQISQKDTGILERIAEALQLPLNIYVQTSGSSALQITSAKDIVRFAEVIGKNCVLKGEQLDYLKRFAQFRMSHERANRTPFTNKNVL